MSANTQSDVLLSVRNLKTYFYARGKEIRAVDGVSFDVRAGEILCIVGESGCGKSMTSLSVMGLVPRPHGRIVGGEILFEGLSLTDLNEYEMADLRGDRISMIFQEPMTSLNPVLRIGDQIAEVLLRHRGMTPAQAEARAVDALRVVGIPRPEAVMRGYPHELSGGMRQRVMIAMAMVCEPALLIADEPTTALDVTIQAQVLNLMRRLRDEFGTAVVFITHDFGVVAEIADDVAVMYAGQIVEYAPADALFEAPLHPYTRALLAAIPSVDAVKETLYSIPGVLPDISEPIEGCRFCGRCDRAGDACARTMPALIDVGGAHFVRCPHIGG